MKRCAFLTLEDPTGYQIDDDLAIPVLEQRGWKVDTIPWTTDDPRWGDYDAVIVRSTWDYYVRPEAFFAVLESIEAADTRLFNDLGVMRWNADKRYLTDLASRGVEVVPSLFGRRLEATDPAHFSEVLGAEKMVIKPVVGANASGAFVLDKSLASEDVLARYRDNDFLVQPFCVRIPEDGEVSLFFFDGDFSHAVRKVPKSGDFRVQEEHGGEIVSWAPPADVTDLAREVLESVEARCLCARVDLVRSNDGEGWWLMELELIEPSMYFRMDPGAAPRFADALDRLMNK